MAGGLSDVRIFRWGYLLPRLAILCVLWAASEHGVAWLLKWSITSGGPALTGARIDVAETRASLLHTRVAIQGLQIADPDQAMQNLASIELVDLDLDTAALLRKKAIVNHGIVRGLRFGTPRTVSGNLPYTAADARRATRSDALSDATSAASNYARDWLAGVEEKLSFDVRGRLESIRLAKELAAKWPAEYESLAAEAKLLIAVVEQVSVETKEANENPLRSAAFLRALPARVKALQQQARDLQARLQALPARVEADRQRLLAARVRDERFIREQFRIEALDAGDLTAYLLSEQLNGPVGELIAWLRWARKLVPSAGKAPEFHRARGEDVLFAGIKQYPDILVRTLDLHGIARLGGRPLEIAGTLTDFTTEPQLHGQPLRLRLMTQGSLPIQLQAVIDRTGKTPRDELLAVCNGLAIPSLSLGNPEQMSLNLAPSAAAVQIAMLLEGEKLAGKIDLIQKQVQISPLVAQRLGTPEIQQALTASLSRVNELSTHVAMTGTLAEPQVKIGSTLGPAVESALRGTVVAVIDRQREKLLATARADTDQRMADMRSKIDSATAEIAPLLAQPEQMLAKLLGPDLAKPFSAEQFGRLPAGTLFK